MKLRSVETCAARQPQGSAFLDPSRENRSVLHGRQRPLRSLWRVIDFRLTSRSLFSLFRNSRYMLGKLVRLAAQDLIQFVLQRHRLRSFGLIVSQQSIKIFEPLRCKLTPPTKALSSNNLLRLRQRFLVFLGNILHEAVKRSMLRCQIGKLSNPFFWRIYETHVRRRDSARSFVLSHPD